MFAEGQGQGRLSRGGDKRQQLAAERLPSRGARRHNSSQRPNVNK
jgi:hypothetical protein